MNKYSIFYYRSPNGKLPVKQFIDSLDRSDREIIFENIDLLALYGFDAHILKPFAGVPKLWEARIPIKDRQVRIFATFRKGQVILLLHGFVKKTPQTPKNEIRIAVRRLKEVI